MPFFQKIFEKIVGRLNIPPLAVKMFRLSNEISGIRKSSLPIELIALNSVQLSRGLLNFTVIQNQLNWVLPFWANEQYNPDSKAFVPRSHLGLSINVTHRNWTAVGSLTCDIEPVIDPCGSLMPFRDGWTIEVWLKTDNGIFFPSAQIPNRQFLINDLPVVQTDYVFEDIKLEIVVYVDEDLLVYNSKVVNDSGKEKQIEIILAVRPFNPEGAGLIHDIKYDKRENYFLINDQNKLFLQTKPNRVLLSNFRKGDCSNFILNGYSINEDEIKCQYGFANALAIYSKKVETKEEINLDFLIPLEKREVKLKIKSAEEIMRSWEEKISEGIFITTPDQKVNSIIKASLSSLLIFCDHDKITPGPYIYHQFWFRDAAYQLNALDKFGYHKLVKDLISKFPAYQKSDGYFQSQKGEWDSNGEAIWTVFQHFLLTGDEEILIKLFSSLYNGIKWIDKKRITGSKFRNEYFYGFLPKGISAEHLGLADYYYWDNFWSIAGIKSFLFICDVLDKKIEKKYYRHLLEEYESTISRSIENNFTRIGKKFLVAAPDRNPDYGMIGSISAFYPLRIFEKDESFFIPTLDYIHKNFFHKNLFFQNFIHSGGNPYLTLQVAHAYLFSGDRDRFFKLFTDVLDYASPTLNFPEAIHPVTRGGVMGDGHHGWASAEILSAVRDAFVFENYFYSKDSIEITLLNGIPLSWFENGKYFCIMNAPLLNGKISLEVNVEGNLVKMKIDFKSNGIYDNERFKIVLPFKGKLCGNENDADIKFIGDETVIILRKVVNEYLVQM